MGVEYVHVYDESGNDAGGYTERVPDLPVIEEPDEDMACGEGHCICYCVGVLHACGCDCPHDPDCNCMDCMIDL